MMDDVYRAADNHSRSQLLQFDLSAAFDTLDKLDFPSPAGPHLRRTWHIPGVGRFLPR